MQRFLPPVALGVYVIFGIVLLIQMTMKPSFPEGWKILSGDGHLRWDANREVMTLYQDSKNLYLKMGTPDLNQLEVISSLPDSQVLLRVDSGGPCLLRGKLPASGNILIINPNGIIVDASAVIDVGRTAILSTLDIADQDLLNGGIHFFPVEPPKGN